MNPPPMISSGTTKKPEAGVFDNPQLIDFFTKEFHKKQKKSLLKGLGYSGKPICILWRPNNYRRKILVKLIGESTRDNMKNHYINTTYSNHNKLLFVKDYPGVILMIGNRSLTGIWSQRIIKGERETFLIEGNSIDDIECFIELKKNEIEAKIDAAILHLASSFNIPVSGALIGWERTENWFRGEDFVNRLPREAIFYDSRSKKVYDDGVEFTSGTGEKNSVVSMLNYLENSQVERVVPELVVRIGNVEKVQLRILERIESLSKRPVHVQGRVLVHKSQKRLEEFG